MGVELSGEYFQRGCQAPKLMTKLLPGSFLAEWGERCSLLGRGGWLPFGLGPGSSDPGRGSRGSLRKDEDGEQKERSGAAADTRRIREPGLGPEMGRDGHPRWCSCRLPSRGKSLVEDELNSRTTRGRNG